MPIYCARHEISYDTEGEAGNVRTSMYRGLKWPLASEAASEAIAMQRICGGHWRRILSAEEELRRSLEGWPSRFMGFVSLEEVPMTRLVTRNSSSVKAPE